MGELNILESILSLGAGAVLGVVIFMMYRRDRKDTEGRWDRLANDLLESRRLECESRDRHTTILSEACTLIRGLNGKGRGNV